MSLALGGARGEGWSLSFLFELMRVDEDCREGGREGGKEDRFIRDREWNFWVGRGRRDV